ncbi:MAG: DUF503 domain-containing protein [Actinobacteria bacterium]|nr:DUF503 domain-containing protein [Actinomycetota bacterium]
MIIGSAEMELFLPEANSLKDKRQIVKSITSKIRNKFNVSVAEIDYNDLWQRALIGISCVSDSDYQARKILTTIEKTVESLNKATIISFRINTFSSYE